MALSSLGGEQVSGRGGDEEDLLGPGGGTSPPEPEACRDLGQRQGRRLQGGDRHLGAGEQGNCRSHWSKHTGGCGQKAFLGAWSRSPAA